MVEIISTELYITSVSEPGWLVFLKTRCIGSHVSNSDEVDTIHMRLSGFAYDRMYKL